MEQTWGDMPYTDSLTFTMSGLAGSCSMPEFLLLDDETALPTWNAGEA